MKRQTFRGYGRIPKGEFEYAARMRRAQFALTKCVEAQVDANWETFEGERAGFEAMDSQDEIVREIRKLKRFESRRKS